MPAGMADEAPLLFVPVGSNAARPFGTEARERACRLATNAGFECADAIQTGRATLLANMSYAWDPAWLKAMRKRPGTVLTFGGDPVMAHVPADEEAGPVAAQMEEGQLPQGYEQLAADSAEAFVVPLDAADPEPVERAAYDAAYKRVTDGLTLYVWPRPGFYLTRWAAGAGIAPNFVTLVGGISCVLAFFLFWRADYWLGILAGLIFMVLDTVDGQLARVMGASSKSGELFDRVIDFVHPPFWYWAWEHGLATYGRALEPVFATMVLWTVIGGYAAQRIVEVMFVRRFGLEIHRWRPVDSKFRLVSAHRNPNLVILAGALLFRRPDIGLKLVALWTLLSLIFHAVRLAQATERAARGKRVVSWLDA